MIKNLLIVASLATLTTLAACSGDKGDTGATATGTGTGTGTGATGTGTGTGTGTPVATEIDLITLPGCDASDNWIYYAETLGWTDSNNIVNSWETGTPNGAGWNDEHTLPSVDFDPAGAWDILERTLTAGVDFASFAPDVNTLYTCGQQDAANVMTYAIRVYDLDGAYADCAIFGSDPTGVDQVFNGMPPSTTPVSASAEIDATNCVEWTVN